MAQSFRDATAGEQQAAARLLEALRRSDGKSTGRLYTDVFPDESIARRDCERLLADMAGAGLVALADASFEKDGRRIDYRKVLLTPEGRAYQGSPPLAIKEAARGEAPARKRKKKAAKQPPAEQPPAKPARARKAAAKGPAPVAAPAAPDPLFQALRAWRLAEAKHRGVPAFRILTDAALEAIVKNRPATARELLAVPGVGIGIVERYGGHIFRILHEGKSW